MPEQFDPSKLADIYLPEAVTLWPLALGWWLLLAAIVLLIAIIIYWLKRTPKVPAPTSKELKSQAMNELLKIREYYESQNDNKSSKEIIHKTIKDLSVFLRRYALSLYPRESVASITDENWLEFLDQLYLSENNSSSEHGSKHKPSLSKVFSKKFAFLLTQVPYQAPESEIDITLLGELFQASESLIKNTYQRYEANISASGKNYSEQKNV